VLGIAFLRFFTQIGLGGTFTGLVLSHIVIVLPFALRLTLASAIGLDRAIEHAAVSLGASEWTVLKRVTLPLVVPGLASGWALAFINSFDEVTMTVFIAAPGTETLPVRMFLYIQDNIDPLVTSVSACVIAVADGIGKGSGRSVPGLPLGQAVIAARQAGLLINGGGHAMAAGFTVAADKIAVLREFLAERLGDGFDTERLVPELSIDGALTAAAAQSALIGHIDALTPFGAANPEPRFAFAGLRVLRAEPVGTGHLKCVFADAVATGETTTRLNAIAFRVADTPLGRFLAETRGRAVHVAGHLRRDDWRGGDAVQLVIDDAAGAEAP